MTSLGWTSVPKAGTSYLMHDVNVKQLLEIRRRVYSAASRLRAKCAMKECERLMNPSKILYT